MRSLESIQFGPMPLTDSSQKSPLDGLTEKQREALDLLVQHKTSKEIGRILSISPHTADQRIQACKEKLGVNSRSELAVEYLRLRSIYERLTYEESRIASAAIPLESNRGSDDELSLVLNDPNRTKEVNQYSKESDYRVVPEMFEGNQGTLFRVAAIGLVAILLVFIVLGGMAILNALTDLLR